MSIDVLQERIRKLKNPSVIDFGAMQIPPHIFAEAATPAAAYGQCCAALLEGLKGLVPAVRFHYSVFSLLGDDGLAVLKHVLTAAKEMNFYVLLDLPGFSAPAEAELAASNLLKPENCWQFDGLILQPYLGQDCLKPFSRPALDGGKTLFVLARTPNRSAPELQDLLTGSRVFHQVVVEAAKRMGNHAIGKCRYNQIGAVISATAPAGIRSMRSTFPELFFLMDGMDFVGGNASNCSNGFDRVGHGAAAIAGASVTDAWVSEEGDGTDFVAQAVQAAERMKRNLTRYITIL